MANILIDSVFNPMSFERLYSPTALYTKEYNDTMDKVSELDQLKEAMRDVATDENPEVTRMFNNYDSSINSFMNKLNRGMTFKDKRDLLKLKSRYNSEIKPIENAVNAFKEEDAFRRNAKTQGYIFKDDNLNVDRFLHGKVPSREALNLKELQADTEKKVANAAVALYGDKHFTDEVVKGGQFFRYGADNGYDLNTLYSIINRIDTKDVPEETRQKIQAFKDIYAGATKQLEGYSMPDVTRGISAINTAMYSGLAKPTYELTTNRNWQSDADKRAEARENERLSMAKKEHDMQATLQAAQLRSIYESKGEVPYAVRDGRGYYKDDTTGQSWYRNIQRSDSADGTTIKDGYLYKNDKGDRVVLRNPLTSEQAIKKGYTPIFESNKVYFNPNTGGYGDTDNKLNQPVTLDTKGKYNTYNENFKGLTFKANGMYAKNMNHVSEGNLDAGGNFIYVLPDMLAPGLQSLLMEELGKRGVDINTVVIKVKHHWNVDDQFEVIQTSSPKERSIYTSKMTNIPEEFLSGAGKYLQSYLDKFAKISQSYAPITGTTGENANNARRVVTRDGAHYYEDYYSGESTTGKRKANIE
jgi:hypothetical protein